MLPPRSPRSPLLAAAALGLARDKGLLRLLLQLHEGRPAQQAQAYAAYGEALEAKGAPEDAALAYVAAGQLDRAVAGERMCCADGEGCSRSAWAGSLLGRPARQRWQAHLLPSLHLCRSLPRRRRVAHGRRPGCQAGVGGPTAARAGGRAGG